MRGGVLVFVGGEGVRGGGGGGGGGCEELGPRIALALALALKVGDEGGVERVRGQCDIGSKLGVLKEHRTMCVSYKRPAYCLFAAA